MSKNAEVSRMVIWQKTQNYHKARIATMAKTARDGQNGREGQIAWKPEW